MAQNPIVTITMEDGGVMKAELYPEIAPNTVNNYISLIKKGYYDGLIFHRVINGFMLQGGDPTGTGMGGPGYSIKCETKAEKQYHDRGVLSMAHAGKDTGGSQFFVCHNRQNTQHLDRVHTCFGRVVEEDWPVIDAIRPGDLIESIKIVED